MHNHGPEEIDVRTNGQVTADTVDPETAEVVGGFAGAQSMPGVSFRIAPGDAVSIPMLVGTASIVATLGYAIRPGRWAIEVIIKLRDQGQLRTPLLPITVIA